MESLPFATEEECITRTLDTLVPSLFCLPDGEIGEKSAAFPKGNHIAWVVYAIEKIHPTRPIGKSSNNPFAGLTAWRPILTIFRS